MKIELKQAIEQLASVKGARFVSITYRAKETGELARHNLLLGVDLVKTYKRDLSIYKRKLRHLSGIHALACSELIASLENSLSKGIGENDKYTCKGVFIRLTKGVKMHEESKKLYLSGLSRSKVVIEKGVYTETNSKEKTIAKDVLRKLGKASKLRTFILEPENLKSVRVNGNTIEIE